MLLILLTFHQVFSEALLSCPLLNNPLIFYEYSFIILIEFLSQSFRMLRILKEDQELIYEKYQTNFLLHLLLEQDFVNHLNHLVELQSDG